MNRLSIMVNQEELVLHGQGITAPLRGCARQPTQFLPSGYCLETLDLAKIHEQFLRILLLIRVLRPWVM